MFVFPNDVLAQRCFSISMAVFPNSPMDSKLSEVQMGRIQGALVPLKRQGRGENTNRPRVRRARAAASTILAVASRLK